MLLSLKRGLFIFSCVASFCAFAGGYPPPPAVDTSTPEKALYTYWAYHDWSRLARQALYEKESITFAEETLPKAMSEITTGKAQQHWGHFKVMKPPVIERKIVQISEEKAGRVEIVANLKYVTPIPVDAKPTALELERREGGSNNRYVIERVGKAWKIAEVWYLGEPALKSTPPPYEIYKGEAPAFICCAILDQ